MRPRDFQALDAIGRQWLPRYRGLRDLRLRQDVVDGGIRIEALVGTRWAFVQVEPKELDRRVFDSNELLAYLDDRVRTAWLSAGGGDGLDVPFRISTRGPKRLQIRREPGFAYPRRMV